MMEYVEKHPSDSWNWIGLSNNRNTTIEYVEKHPEKPWDWYNLSLNPDIGVIWFRL